MKILHTADIHLREYDDDRWKTLQKLIEIGKKEKIEIFVISGDLFDKGINAENLRPKIREIFSNTNFKIVIIPRNHDSDSYASGMYFGEDAVILTDLDNPFKYKDINIVIIGDHPKDKALAENLRAPFIGVLTGHHSAAELQQSSTTKTLILSSVKEIEPNMIYSLL